MPNAPIRAILFLSSYSPLFVILVIRDSFESVGWSVALIGISLTSIAVLLTYLKLAGSLEPHFATAREVYPRGTEAIGYIVTYLIPFLDVDLGDDETLASLALLLGVIGVLYVNSNLIYINPVLNLMGFHLFEVATDQGKPSALLTRRDYVPPGERLKVVSLGNYVLLEKS